MLSKENRINKDKDFDRAFKTGQSFYSQVLGVKVVKNNRSANRFGILISTKVSKKAVVRNHLRRQIREIIKQEEPKLKKGYDFVLIVLVGIIDKSFLDIQTSLRSVLAKVRAYSTASTKTTTK